MARLILCYRRRDIFYKQTDTVTRIRKLLLAKAEVILTGMRTGLPGRQ